MALHTGKSSDGCRFVQRNCRRKTVSWKTFLVLVLAALLVLVTIPWARGLGPIGCVLIAVTTRTIGGNLIAGARMLAVVVITGASRGSGASCRSEAT